MSAQVVERPDSLLENTRAEMLMKDMIGESLERLEKLAEAEAAAQLEYLILTANRLELPRFAREGQIDELVEAVPGAAELVQVIHETAEHALHDGVLRKESALITVNNIGVAADIAQDKSLIIETLKAIEHTDDAELDMPKRALKVAQTGEQLYVDAMRDIKSGKATTRAAGKNFVPMNQRPDFEGADAYLSNWNERKGGAYTTPVEMSSFDDLYGDAHPNYAKTVEMPFTTEDVKRTTISRALSDFVLQTKRKN